MYPTLPANEVERVQAVRRYERLFRPHRQHHHELTRMVASALDVPMAFVTLLDVNQQRFLACHGVHLPPIDRRFSLCAHLTPETDVEVVSNTLRDKRFQRNPLVRGEPTIRFYAGAPLRTRCGQVVGSLFIADALPRTLSSGHRDLLAEFAEMIMEEAEGERPATTVTE